jgi:hypothetical protein
VISLEDEEGVDSVVAWKSWKSWKGRGQKEEKAAQHNWCSFRKIQKNCTSENYFGIVALHFNFNLEF